MCVGGARQRRQFWCPPEARIWVRQPRALLACECARPSSSTSSALTPQEAGKQLHTDTKVAKEIATLSVRRRARWERLRGLLPLHLGRSARRRSLSACCPLSPTTHPQFTHPPPTHPPTHTHTHTYTHNTTQHNTTQRSQEAFTRLQATKKLAATISQASPGPSEPLALYSPALCQRGSPGRGASDASHCLLLQRR